MIAAATNTGTAHSISAKRGQAGMISRESNGAPLSLEYPVHSTMDCDDIAVEVAADALCIADNTMQARLHQYACLVVVETLRDVNSDHLVVLDFPVIPGGN